MSASSGRAREPANSLELHGESATLVFRRFLPHPPEVVWRAITDPAEMAHWHLTSGRIEGRVGGRIELVTGPTQVRSTGQVLAWDPPRRFEYDWDLVPTDAWPAGEHARVRWDLSEHDGGTLLVLTQQGLTKRTARVFSQGMPGFLERLAALLDHRPLPDWLDHVRRLRATDDPTA